MSPAARTGPFRGHKSTVRGITFTADGKLAASCDEGGSVILWTRNGIPSRELRLNPPSSGKLHGGIHEISSRPTADTAHAQRDGTVYVCAWVWG